MDLYFYLCGMLFILTTFGVFENILKICKINKLFASLFFLINLIFYFLPNFYLFGININLNIFLYIFACVIQLFKKNSIKDLISGVLVCLVTISVLVCYNATNMSEQYVFVSSLTYISIAVGFLLFCICKSSFSSMFVGSVLGTICYELVTFDFKKFIAEEFVFFDTNITTYILCSSIIYCICLSVLFVISRSKIKKELTIG